MRLTWGIDSGARAALEQDLFGKHVLITDHDDWPAGEVIAGYRSQSEAEFSFRQLKDPRVVSISPMFHWTGHNIRVHIFTCVPALQIAHLMRLKAARAGLHLSVRELPAGLAAIAMMGTSPTPRTVTAPSGAVDSSAIRRGRRFVKCTSPLSNGKPAVLRTSVAGHRVRRRSCVCFCGCGQARACARGRILSSAGESGGVLARVGWCGCLGRSLGVGGGGGLPGGAGGWPKPGWLGPMPVAGGLFIAAT